MVPKPEKCISVASGRRSNWGAQASHGERVVTSSFTSIFSRWPRPFRYIYLDHAAHLLLQEFACPVCFLSVCICALFRYCDLFRWPDKSRRVLFMIRFVFLFHFLHQFFGSSCLISSQPLSLSPAPFYPHPKRNSSKTGSTCWKLFRLFNLAIKEFFKHFWKGKKKKGNNYFSPPFCSCFPSYVLPSSQQQERLTIYGPVTLGFWVPLYYFSSGKLNSQSHLSNAIATWTYRRVNKQNLGRCRRGVHRRTRKTFIIFGRTMPYTNGSSQFTLLTINNNLW